MTVIQMSGQELTRLRIMIDLADSRITIEAAAALMGLGRRQVYRLRRAFSADGAPALISGKRGRPSNRRHGETFRRTVLALVRQHYRDFRPPRSRRKSLPVSEAAPGRRDAEAMDRLRFCSWPGLAEVEHRAASTLASPSLFTWRTLVCGPI